MTDIVERLRDIQQYAVQLSDVSRAACGQAADEIERLNALLQKLSWKSIDKDNMEFSCRIPYNVMDEIRRALENKP